MLTINYDSAIFPLDNAIFTAKRVLRELSVPRTCFAVERRTGDFVVRISVRAIQPPPVKGNHVDD